MNDFTKIDRDWAWAPYDGQGWNQRLATHLFRRAGFGGSTAEIKQATKKTPAQVVDQLLGNGASSDRVEQQVEQLTSAILNTGKAENLAAAWLYRLIYTPNQLTEKGGTAVSQGNS